MEKKIKLIWDFRGPHSKKTAKHHCVHLKEYAEIEDLQFHEINISSISEMHTIAFITVNENQMKIFRDTLKPHRGQLA